jgi:choline dehydrogenase-like flavoprotein
MHFHQREEYDAIVIGSGIAGGWAAKELTEKGLKTLLLERGRNVEHGKDYITEHQPNWQFPLRERRLTPENAGPDYPVQSRIYAFREATRHFFVKDSEHPYTEAKPYTWIQGNQVGGRCLMWGRQVYRWSDLDFEANRRDGHGVDWPIRYRDIAPWYSHVERFIGVSGEKLGLPYLPDGEFQPPMEMNAGEKLVKAGLERSFPGRHMTIGRVAVLTEALGSRAPCHYCGPCFRGCSTGSYFSSNASTLPAARATGNLTLRPNSIVHSIIYGENTNRAGYGRAIRRCGNQGDARGVRSPGVPVRVYAGQHAHPAQLHLLPVSQWPGKLQRRARALPDGSPVPGRCARRHPGAGGPLLPGQPPQWDLHPALPEPASFGCGQGRFCAWLRLSG